MDLGSTPINHRARNYFGALAHRLKVHPFIGRVQVSTDWPIADAWYLKVELEEAIINSRRDRSPLQWRSDHVLVVDGYSVGNRGIGVVYGTFGAKSVKRDFRRCAVQPFVPARDGCNPRLKSALYLLQVLSRPARESNV